MPSLLTHVRAILKQRRGDIEILTHILGHSSSATTIDMYGTLSIDDVHANYERIIAQAE